MKWVTCSAQITSRIELGFKTHVLPLHVLNGRSSVIPLNLKKNYNNLPKKNPILKSRFFSFYLFFMSKYIIESTMTKEIAI